MHGFQNYLAQLFISMPLRSFTIIAYSIPMASACARIRMCICVHVRCTWAFRFKSKVKICILRPYQKYYTYIMPIFNQRWAKPRVPREKPSDLSVQKFGISHVPRARLEHFKVSFCFYINFSAAVRARLMILGQHLLLDETI